MFRLILNRLVNTSLFLPVGSGVYAAIRPVKAYQRVDLAAMSPDELTVHASNGGGEWVERQVTPGTVLADSGQREAHRTIKDLTFVMLDTSSEAITAATTKHSKAIASAIATAEKEDATVV